MRIGVDIDGVLADFNTRFIETVIDVTGVDLFPPRPFDIPCWSCPEHYGYTDEQNRAIWNEITSDLGFWRSLPEYPTTFSDIVYLLLKEHRGHDVYFITSRPGINAKQQTEDWFRRMGPVAKMNPTVLISSEKGLCAQALKLDVYIDDRWENVVDVKVRSHATVFLMVRPWNREQHLQYVAAGSPNGVIWPVHQVDGIIESVEAMREQQAA